MDFRDLRYFEVIAEEGHVGRAAERLYKTQPALTKCVDRLEDELGAPLFERVGRGIRLTAVGQALLNRARRISLMMDETAREIGDYANGREGNIRLGCVPTLAEHILPGICEQLLTEAQKVTIDLKVSMNDALLAGLKAGELDIVLGPMIQSDDVFHTEEIMRDEMVVMASASHPIFQQKIRLRTLLEHQWVLPATSVLSRQWLDNVFDRHHLARPSVQITPTVLNMIMPLIERSNLLGFASRLNLDARPGKLREVALKETTMLRRMGLTYRRDMYLSPAAQRLIGILRRQTGTPID